MILPGGMYMRNSADIVPDLEYIRNTYMNELYEIVSKRLKDKNQIKEKGDEMKKLSCATLNLIMSESIVRVDRL